MSMRVGHSASEVIDVVKAGILDSYAVKQQVMRSSIESAAMLLRIDQIVSGVSHQKARTPRPERQSHREANRVAIR